MNKEGKYIVSNIRNTRSISFGSRAQNKSQDKKSIGPGSCKIKITKMIYLIQIVSLAKIILTI